MWKDEIVEEIHQIREAYAKSFNYDLDAIFEDLRKKESESGREVVSLPQKHGLTTRSSGRARDIAEDAQDTSRRST